MCKRGMDRREFLKSSTAGLGAFLFISPGGEPRAGKLSIAQLRDPAKFAHRVLGKTGLRLPAITMGVMNSDNPNLIRAALDAGMKHLDTAHAYMRGKNEEVIGEVLKGRARDSFFITTKVGLPRNETTGLYEEGATEAAFLSRLDISLKRLGLEYVDILHHHGLSKRQAVLYEPIMKAMETAKKEGKIRFAGVSTHSNEPEVIQAAIDSKLYDVVATAYNFRQKHQEEMKQAIAKAAEAGLGVIGMKAMGGSPRSNYGRDKQPEDAQVALKWVFQNPNVHMVIAGFTAFDELEMDLKIMENMSLTKKEKAYLDRAMGTASLYCQGCGKCLGSCRQNLPIPDLMRAYMYVYGYRNLGAAQDLLADLRLPSQVCGDCTSCPVQCVSGFPVSSRIRDVVRVREVPPEFIA
jgi:predicted aldo/keto reductase-like oxidoreductase